MQVKTIDSERIWQSPDGQKIIWAVALESADGTVYRLKTYSRHIAQMGFSGDVYTYATKQGERFVRQQPKVKAGEAGRKSGYRRDDDAIRAQWAIGQAINLASVKMDKEAITLPVIERYARELFATVSRVKGDPVTPELEAQAANLVRGGLVQTAAF